MNERIRNPWWRYELGRLAWHVLMLWPLAFYDRSPSLLHGWAWLYAEDARSYPAARHD